MAETSRRSPRGHRGLPRPAAARLTLPLLIVPTLLRAAESAAPASASSGGDMGQVVLAGLAILLLTVGFMALTTFWQLLRPARCRAAAVLAGQSPFRCWIYGILTLLIVILQLALAKTLPPLLGILLTLAFTLPCFILLLIGAAAVAHALGEKLLTNTGSPGQMSDVWAVLTGSALLGLLNLIPVIGQVITVLALCIGLGAAVRRALRRRPERLEDESEPARG